MVSLIKTLSEKMKGFSRKETITYYEQIIERAWAQVTAAATPEVKSQKYEEVMDWTMADKNYDDQHPRCFRQRTGLPAPMVGKLRPELSPDFHPDDRRCSQGRQNLHDQLAAPIRFEYTGQPAASARF